MEAATVRKRLNWDVRERTLPILLEKGVEDRCNRSLTASGSAPW